MQDFLNDDAKMDYWNSKYDYHKEIEIAIQGTHEDYCREFYIVADSINNRKSTSSSIRMLRMGIED